MAATQHRGMVRAMRLDELTLTGEPVPEAKPDYGASEAHEREKLFEPVTQMEGQAELFDPDS